MIKADHGISNYIDSISSGEVITIHPDHQGQSHCQLAVHWSHPSV